MCFLGVCVADKFDKSDLMRACESNPDGFGYAFTTKGGIEYVNTFNADEAINGLAKLCKRYPDGVGLFHARWATHGATSLENCHPFVVNDKTVLGHNGVLPLTPAKGDTRSDTAIFAQEVMPQWLHTLDTGEIAPLEQWAAGSKVAILTCDKRLRDSVYILNESLGHWRGGCWYSNDSYKPARKYSNWFTSATKPAPKFEYKPLTAAKPTHRRRRVRHSQLSSFIKCDICYAWHDIESDYCPECFCCTDCGRLKCSCIDVELWRQDELELIAQYARARKVG